MNKIFNLKGSCYRRFQRPISKVFLDHLVEKFGFNGRFKNGIKFLNFHKIPKLRQIQENAWTKVEAFQVRVGKPRKIDVYTSNATISIKFCRTNLIK